MNKILRINWTKEMEVFYTENYKHYKKKLKKT